MQKLKKVLFALLLTTAAILSAPKVSLASGPCSICEATAQCVPCCRCGGNTQAECLLICN